MKVKSLFVLMLILMSFASYTQKAKIVTQVNASPLQSLFVEESLLEGYEWAMVAPVINDVNGYIKTALPTDILNNNATSNVTLFSDSKIKTNIIDVILINDTSSSINIKKGSFFLTKNIKITPPQKCYVSFNEFKNDNNFKKAGFETGSKKSFIKFIAKKGDLNSDGNIVVEIDKIHCGTKSYKPWIDLILYGKPVYCAIDFAFTCAKVDEVSLIKEYMPFSANYLIQGYTNPENRDLLNEIRPDGVNAVIGNKNSGIPITIFNNLETIEKYENSKETMHNLFNRVTAQSTKQSIISLVAMHELFEKGSTCGPSRESVLINYVKSSIPKYYEQIAAVTEEAIRDYVKVVPCGRYFFEPSLVEENSKEFNSVITKINNFCKNAFEQYSRAGGAFTTSTKLQGMDDLSYLDRGLTGYANFQSNAAKNASLLSKEADNAIKTNMSAAQFLLQKLMATKYFKFFYSELFSEYVGKFDLKKCVSGSSIKDALTMKPIPSNSTERLSLLTNSGKELISAAKKSITDLLETKNSIVYYASNDQEISNHKERKDKLIDYLLSYTLSFKQYKSIAPARSREFLLSTKLVGAVLNKDQRNASRNKAINITVSTLAAAGGILAITIIGAPAGSLLASLSATVNSWAVLTISTATIMTNAGVNWDKAVTEAEFAKIAGATNLRQDENNYKDLTKALDEKSAAVTNAVTTVAFAALPVGAYAILKKMPLVAKVLGLGKGGIKEEQAFAAFDKGSIRYKESGLTNKTFGTFVSAKIEDEALFKAIIGQADDPSQIIKNASSVKTEAEYNTFIKELNRGINENGIIDYKQIEVSTLPTTEKLNTYIKNMKSDYTFVSDALESTDKTKTLNTLLNKIESYGIKPETIDYKNLMTSFEKVHVAKGNILDNKSAKFSAYMELKTKYSEILIKNNIPNSAKVARNDLKPLLDKNILGDDFPIEKYYPDIKVTSDYIPRGTKAYQLWRSRTPSNIPDESFNYHYYDVNTFKANATKLGGYSTVKEVPISQLEQKQKINTDIDERLITSDLSNRLQTSGQKNVSLYKPQITKYYKGEETTIPITYKKALRDLRFEDTTNIKESVMTKLFGKYGNRAPYQLSPEILEGAIRTGEANNSSRALKYFIKNDGTIEVTAEFCPHIETINKYVAHDEKLIRSAGSIYSTTEQINGETLYRLYLSPRGGDSCINLEKYFNDYLKYMYKEAGKEMPFIELDGKLYYRTAKKQFTINNEYLNTEAQKYTFITDATLTEQKEALKTFFSNLEVKGITPSDDLMTALNDVHKAEGVITNPTTAKYKKYIIAKEKYTTLLKENGVSDHVKMAREDLKHLLDTGILGSKLSGKPDIVKYYKGEETTIPIKYERVYGDFNPGNTVYEKNNIITKLYGVYGNKAPYKLSPEILEGAIETGEVDSGSRALKYFIKNDGTIEVTSDLSLHQETINKYVAQNETSIRGFGNIYSGIRVINNKTMRRLYLSPRGGNSGIDLEKYFNDYLKYMYKESGKEIPFIELDGKLYYQY